MKKKVLDSYWAFKLEIIVMSKERPAVCVNLTSKRGSNGVMLMLQKLIADAKDRPGKVGQVMTGGKLDCHSATLWRSLEDHASGDVEGVVVVVVVIVVVDFWPRAQLQAMETEATAAEAESQGDYEVCGWNVMAGEYRNANHTVCVI